MRLSEVIQEVIRLGDASRVYWDAELHKRHPQYPIIRAGEEAAPPPPEAAQIESLLRTLPEDQLYALMLFAYIGRGDFSVDHLLPAYQAIRETFSSKNLAIAQLTAEQTLAEYLIDAREEARKRHIDLDELRFENAVSVS